MVNYPKDVVIEEQGLRDGLQSEKALVPKEKKLELINAVVDAGVKRGQVTSFVHPKLVPQMADAEDVCRGLQPTPGVIFSGLVLNTRGIERAAGAGEAGQTVDDRIALSRLIVVTWWQIREE